MVPKHPQRMPRQLKQATTGQGTLEQLLLVTDASYSHISIILRAAFQGRYLHSHVTGKKTVSREIEQVI